MNARDENLSTTASESRLLVWHCQDGLEMNKLHQTSFCETFFAMILPNPCLYACLPTVGIGISLESESLTLRKPKILRLLR